MSVTTISSRELNHDVGKAKKAALTGPVFITHRGRAAHVLLTIEEYQKLTSSKSTIVELLAMPNKDEIEFEPEHMGANLYKPADFS